MALCARCSRTPFRSIVLTYLFAIHSMASCAWSFLTDDAEQLGGHREDERGLKAEHPAHFGAQGADPAIERGFRGEWFGRGAKVGLCGELATVGADGLAHGASFRLAVFDSDGFEVAGGGQDVEGGGGHGRAEIVGGRMR